MRVNGLARRIAQIRVQELLAVDREAVERGNLEPWLGAQLLLDLPNKWDLSCYVADSDDALSGYRVVSGRSPLRGFAHSHRVSVLPSKRRGGRAAAMLQWSLLRAEGAGFSGLTAYVVDGNTGGRAYLAATGWIETRWHKDRKTLWLLER